MHASITNASQTVSESPFVRVSEPRKEAKKTWEGEPYMLTVLDLVGRVAQFATIKSLKCQAPSTSLVQCNIDAEYAAPDTGKRTRLDICGYVVNGNLSVEITTPDRTSTELASLEEVTLQSLQNRGLIGATKNSGRGR